MKLYGHHWVYPGGAMTDDPDNTAETTPLPLGCKPVDWEKLCCHIKCDNLFKWLDLTSDPILF